jgi:hypothetical protein
VEIPFGHAQGMLRLAENDTEVVTASAPAHAGVGEAPPRVLAVVVPRVESGDCFAANGAARNDNCRCHAAVSGAVGHGVLGMAINTIFCLLKYQTGQVSRFPVRDSMTVLSDQRESV